MLEVIDKGSCTEAHPVPLLFVHGGWHGAWCWDDGFLDYFADAGYRAVAMSLRGHGTSPSDKPLPKVSIADYIDDVRAVADDLGGSPVLIGHSLGGYTIQRYLEDRTAAAAVLVGSLPPSGVLGTSLRVWRRRPKMTVESWNDLFQADHRDFENVCIGERLPPASGRGVLRHVDEVVAADVLRIDVRGGFDNPGEWNAIVGDVQRPISGERSIEHEQRTQNSEVRNLAQRLLVVLRSTRDEPPEHRRLHR